VSERQTAGPYCELFREAMGEAGIMTHADIIPDGRLHRFHVEGDKKDSKNGWYVLHSTPYPVGRFGAWNRDGTHTWELPFQKPVRREERDALEKRREETKAAQAAEIEGRQAKARKIAEYVWKHTVPAPQGYAYLKKKGIEPNGARLYRGMLVVPVQSVEGTLHSLQLISPSGEKRFLFGGRTGGCCYGIGRQGKRIYIAEGFATGATIQEATGEAVVIAFYAGNLKSVATALHKQYPEAELIIAADDDQWTDGNPGQAKATEAAEAVKAKLTSPLFRDTSTRPTDFNDLFLLHGAEEVRKQLEPMRLCAVPDALAVFTRRFVFMSEPQARVVVLWIAHTYVIAAVDATPYLSITSPEKRSGKTRLLEVLATVAPKPWLTGRVTAAVLVRKIDGERPTLLLDESDAAFAGQKEYAERFRLRKVVAEAARLRAQLQTWAAAAVEGLRDAEPTLPDELTDRQQDGAEPLLAIADTAGGTWSRAARNALVELCTGDHSAEDSVGVRLLADIKGIFEERKANRLASAELAQALGSIETLPWGEWSKGKPITQAQLASLLRPYEISPKSVRTGKKTPKGYYLKDFEDAFGRYVRSDDLPSRRRENATPPQTSSDAGSSHFPNRHRAEDVAPQKPDKSYGMSDVADVAVSSSGTEAGEGSAEPVKVDKEWSI